MSIFKKSIKRVAKQVNNQSQSASISSTRTNRTYVFKINTLLTIIVVVILLILSFYGGVLYGHSQHQPFSRSFSKAEHKFAIGLVVYTSNNSITINNANTKTDREYKVTKNTIVSINGSPAKISQIVPGNRVLIRVVRGKPSTAGVIIVNSKFTD